MSSLPNWLELVHPVYGKLEELLEKQMVKGHGKGGQKINKTSSKVRLQYSELFAASQISRSAKTNYFDALQKLKLSIALEIDLPEVASSRPIADLEKNIAADLACLNWNMNSGNPYYSVLCGYVVDSFVKTEASLKETAALFGLNPAGLSKRMARFPQLEAKVKKIYNLGKLKETYSEDSETSSFDQKKNSLSG